MAIPKRDIRRAFPPGRGGKAAGMNARALELDLGMRGDGTGDERIATVTRPATEVPAPIGVRDRPGMNGAFYALDAEGFRTAGPLTAPATATGEVMTPFHGKIIRWELAAKVFPDDLVAESCTIDVFRNDYQEGQTTPVWVSITDGNYMALDAQAEAYDSNPSWDTEFWEGDEFQFRLLTVGTEETPAVCDRIEVFLLVEVLNEYDDHNPGVPGTIGQS